MITLRALNMVIALAAIITLLGGLIEPQGMDADWGHLAGTLMFGAVALYFVRRPGAVGEFFRLFSDKTAPPPRRR